MKRPWFLLASILSLAFIFSSCEDKPQEELMVDLQVRLLNQGQPVRLNDTLVIGSYEMAFKKFKLYLSKLDLIDASGGTVRFKEVCLLDLAEPGSFTLRGKVPNRAYTEMRYGIGLDSLLNESDPSQFPDAHPLSSFQQMYWTMLKYRFFIIEGRSNWQDSLGSNNDVLNAYHVGSDSLYRPKNLLFNSVTNESRANLDILLEIDVEDFFTGPFPVDLMNEPQTHSEPVNYPIARKLMDNLSFGIRTTVSSY